MGLIETLVPFVDILTGRPVECPCCGTYNTARLDIGYVCTNCGTDLSMLFALLALASAPGSAAQMQNSASDEGSERRARKPAVPVGIEVPHP